MQFGETVLVLGGGVVGLLVARLLKLGGAGAVLLVDPLEQRRELALGGGADDLVGAAARRRRGRRVRPRSPRGALDGGHPWAGGGRRRRDQRIGGRPAGRHRRRGDRR